MAKNIPKKKGTGEEKRGPRWGGYFRGIRGILAKRNHTNTASSTHPPAGRHLRRVFLGRARGREEGARLAVSRRLQSSGQESQRTHNTTAVFFFFSWRSAHAQNAPSAMTSELSKPWQGSPPTAFKPKKPFMPRLVRSNKPDHVIGPSALLQVCGWCFFRKIGIFEKEGRVTHDICGTQRPTRACV